MPDNLIKKLMDACVHMEFRLPISDHDTKWEEIHYDEYLIEPALPVLQGIYQKLMGYAVGLISGARIEIESDLLKEDKLKDLTPEQIEELIDETAKPYQDFVCFNIRYYFYRAIATAQNAVVLSYFGDDWDTAELSELFHKIDPQMAEVIAAESATSNQP